MSIQRPISDEPRFNINAVFNSHAGEEQALGPCLFVSRETGAGGGEIARRAAECLGWHLLDKGILDQLSSQYGTSRSMLDVVDEKKVDWLADILNGWIEGHGFSQLAYVHRLHGLFVAAAKRGSLVIVGRGARFMLPRRSGFSVRIIAPLHERINRIVDDFLKKYFHHDVTNPHVHDLVINTEQLGDENSLNLLLSAVQSWLKSRPSTASIAVARRIAGSSSLATST
jgi:cytidylate kinase